MYMAAPIRPFDLSLWRKMPRKWKTNALIFMIQYHAHGLCLMVAISVDACACVCIGNQESHLPQQIFPGDWWSQCAVITNMICACTEHCCTWLICCTTCLCRDSFVCFCCIITCWIAERQAGEQVHRCRKRWWKHRCCFSLCSLLTHLACCFLWTESACYVYFVRRASCITAMSCCWHGYFYREERLEAKKKKIRIVH